MRPSYQLAVQTCRVRLKSESAPEMIGRVSPADQLRVCCSLHKSLASDPPANGKQSSAEPSGRQLKDTTEQLKAALADRFQLTNQLHQEQELRAEAEAKATK